MVSSRLEGEKEMKRQEGNAGSASEDPQTSAEIIRLPFTRLVEVLVGVNLFQAEVFLFNPERQRRLRFRMAVVINVP